MPPGPRPRVIVNKKPLVWFPVGSGAVVMVILVATFVGGTTANVVAAILGLFGSIVVLGVARAVERERAADGSYTEWNGIGAARLVTLLTMTSWFLGMANVFFVAKEITR